MAEEAQAPGQYGAGVAVVTGAARGIGLATARRLARSGGTVVALDRDPDTLRAAVDDAARDGMTLLGRVVDVTDPTAVEAVVADVEQDVGPVTRLVAAAGVLRVGALLDDDALDALDAQWDVNVRGVLGVVRAVGRHMAARRGGAIVVVSSNAASTPRLGIGAYAATKSATTMLARCLALELAPHGVRCNVVSPGSTHTPMLHGLWGVGDVDADDVALDAAAREAVAGSPAEFRLGIPLGRVAVPDDVAEAIAYLLSDAARHVTAHDLRVDGGATLDAHA